MMNTIWLLKWKDTGEYVSRNGNTRDISKALMFLTREDLDKGRKGKKRVTRVVRMRGRLADALMRIVVIQAQNEAIAGTVATLQVGFENFREALNKIQLGRHGKLNTTEMALVAWGALNEHTKLVGIPMMDEPEEPTPEPH